MEKIRIFFQGYWTFSQKVFPAIVIVLSAMFILQLWTELEGEHCRYVLQWLWQEKLFTKWNLKNVMSQITWLTFVTDRDLAETTESRPLCVTDLFQNKSVAYFWFVIVFTSSKIFFLLYFMHLFSADATMFLKKI